MAGSEGPSGHPRASEKGKAAAAEIVEGAAALADPSETVTAAGGSLVMVVEEEPSGKGSAVAADCQG